MNECSATDFVYSAISFFAIMSLDLYILSNTYIVHPAKFSQQLPTFQRVYISLVTLHGKSKLILNQTDAVLLSSE